MAEVVDQKLKAYRQMQAGSKIKFCPALYQYLSSDIQQLYLRKQQILSQFNENTLVKGVRGWTTEFKKFLLHSLILEQELDLLDEESAVHKLVGPILMKVELDEAKANVNKRLEFIESEI